MVARAARKPELAGRLAVADAAALPVASGAAELVICALTLGHLADPAPALLEFARVLEPGGTLLLMADVLARSLVAPEEVPVGVLTALLGGSYLIWLLRRGRTP